MKQTQNRVFEIDLDIYKGPFELLISLIQKHEVDICDVPIASITKDFLDHVRAMATKDMESISGFLIVAAALLQLKANALFIKDEDDDLELEEGMDSDQMSGEELIASLIRYKTYKNASAYFEERSEREGRFIERQIGTEFIDLKPNFLRGISPAELAEAYLELINKTDPVVDLTHIVGAEYTIEQKIEYVIKYFSVRKNPTTFSELTSMCRNKIERIVTFLALLELYRAGAVALTQSENFGEIEVKPKNLNYVANLN